MPSPPLISHQIPILYVSDFARSVDYYVDQLGFEKQWDWGDPPDFGCVRRDGISLFFCQGGQGQPGTWISMFVYDVDVLYQELVARGANLLGPPKDEPWGMREFHAVDPDGHTFRFGTGFANKDLEVERVPLACRIEKRLALVVEELAARTKRTVGEVLEETLLHSFEPIPGREGDAAASPHSRYTLGVIEELVKKHGLDYEAHDANRFTEK